MIHFPQLHSKRLTIDLQELTFGQSLELAAMPRYQFEASISKFLRFVVKAVVGEQNPLLWTVQERMLVVAHYLSCINDGEPNFAIVGSQATGYFLDYLDFELELSESLTFDGVEIGTLGGDEWILNPLTGEMAEAIERLDLAKNLGNRGHWLIAAMAAQLRIKGESYQFNSQNELDAWLSKRIATFMAYPANAFEALYVAYRVNFERINQLFKIDFDDHGIVALPKEVEGNLPSARFRVFTCLPKSARQDFSGIYA